MGFLGFTFARIILNILHTPEDTLINAVTYLRIVSVRFIYIDFLAFYHYFNLLIKINLRIMGVGISTKTFQIISAFLCYINANYNNSYFRLEIPNFYFSQEIFLKVLKIGILMALQNFFIALSFR